MEQLFINIYDFFQRRRRIFWTVFSLLTIFLAVGASRITIEEDITKFFPDDDRVEKLNYVFQHSKLAERIVVMISVKDSATSPAPDSLVSFTEELLPELDSVLGPYSKSISSQVDDTQVMKLFKAVRSHLPVFLDEKDYRSLDSMVNPIVAKQTLRENYKLLISPSGIVTKDILVNDPLGFSFLILKKLQQLQYDKNFELYDNYILTRDHRHLLFFIQSKYKPNDTGKNLPLITELDRVIRKVAPRHPYITASFFGATAVAAGNARQLQNDSILTISMMLILLAIFLIGYFRKKRVPFLILIPVAFGGVFSLCCVYLIQGSISILAIAAGSIILGIAVNYSLHFLAHLKHVHDVKEVIRDLVKPMTLGSTTTVLAFFCLQFVNAGVLQDLGLFAGFSLIGSALCSLIFLPQLIPIHIFEGKSERQSWIERISFSARSSKYIVLFILVLTPVFFYFARQVSFNTDISKLNYMEEGLRQAQQRLETISKSSLSAVYITSQGRSLESVLQKTERVIPQLEQLQRERIVQRFNPVSSFMISDSLQKIRIKRWQKFWKEHDTHQLLASIREENKSLKFSDQVFQNFENLITRVYTPLDKAALNALCHGFFDDYIIEQDSLVTIITLVHADPSHRKEIDTRLFKKEVSVFDRQMLANMFVEYVHADFNFIVTFTSLLVFLALLISYGRIELTLVTFIPMLITWIWILGIMALVGIEFNIVNVMISTFIFGLGDDYSIFIMDGLQQEYKFKKQNLPSIRISILLSALTTISGLGVLIFAQHPALRSIAAISIIGIACVFMMSQTIEPFLFRWLISSRTTRGLAPMTFWGICKTIFTYGFFVAGSFVLTLIGLLLKLIPAGRNRTRLVFHTLLSFFTRSLLYLTPQLPIRILNKTQSTFSHPGILISNHSSFLDILLTTSLHPRLILLTNKWVWNSPVFGGVVRLADYYPVSEGAEDSTHRLRDRVNEAYSVVVFPEGTRSQDGSIGRFHKGAFYMAEELKLPIKPLLIHGASDAIPKNTMYVNTGRITLKFLPDILPNDTAFGNSYSEKAKAIGKYFREEYQKLASEVETPEYFRYKLLTNYLYKGPVLEWYARIKLRLEKYYEPFHQLIPLRAKILDLGCGYGFMSYMLHFLSAERQIIGVDYDAEKIETASHNYSKTDQLVFIHADITMFELQQYDTIIIADVLHYLKPDAQEMIIKKCIEALNPGGKLIIREGNADLNERHTGTRITEFFSVKLFRFNKSVNTLHFISGSTIEKLAGLYGCSVHIVDETKYTSNVIFVVERMRLG